MRVLLQWDRRAMLKPALLLQDAMGLDDMLARDVVGNDAVTKRGRKLVAGIFKLGECRDRMLQPDLLIQRQPRAAIGFRVCTDARFI
jgi:hypothetical protein